MQRRLGRWKPVINQKGYLVIEIAYLVLRVSMFAIAAILWPSLPALLPVHWTGLSPAIPTRIDSYGGKTQALLHSPAIALAPYLSLLFASGHFESRRTQGTVGLARFGLACRRSSHRGT